MLRLPLNVCQVSLSPEYKGIFCGSRCTWFSQQKSANAFTPLWQKVLLWLPSEGNGNLWAPFMPKQALDRVWAAPYLSSLPPPSWTFGDFLLPLASPLVGEDELLESRCDIWSELTWPLHFLGSESLSQHVNTIFPFSLTLPHIVGWQQPTLKLFTLKIFNVEKTTTGAGNISVLLYCFIVDYSSFLVTKM